MLRLIVRRTEKGYGGGTLYGNTYDLSAACLACGTGAQRTSPLTLKKSELPPPNGLIQTGQGETLSAEDVATGLSSARITGLELRPIRAWKSGELLPWVELFSTFEMPPMSPATSGGEREDPCEVCNRDGYFDSRTDPLVIAYSARDLNVESVPDVVHTWECFGNSRLAPTRPAELPGAWFAQALLLVKPRVASLLRQLRVARLDFDPVRIVE